MKDKKNNIQLTELFASYVGHKWFHGTIKEIEDSDGNLMFHSTIMINDGYIVAQNSSRDELSNQLNRLTEMVVLGGVNNIKPKTIDYMNENLYLN